VYWDNDVGAFRGTERMKWSYSEWFAHIVEVCTDFGISLSLSSTPEWAGVPESDQKEILASQTV